MPGPDLFAIDQLVEHGRLNAAAEDIKRKQSSASPVVERNGRNGHGSARSSTSDRDRPRSPAGSPRESHHPSSRGSPRDDDGRRGSSSYYSRRAERRSHDSDRYRSRSRSPHSSYYRSSYRDRSTSRDRDRDRDGGRHGRYNRRPRSPPRDQHDNYEHRSYGGRGHNSSRNAPEPATDGSDIRTVFVSQLAMRVGDAHLRKFFSEAGPVEKATVLTDRHTGRSKGFGYVQFKDIESIERAVGLTGRKLMGIPVIVALTEADKNRAAKKNEGPMARDTGAPFHRLYVGNIHFSITEDDLKDMFGVYGELSLVEMSRDETGRSRGYAFVQFVESDEARTALNRLNGFELAGRPMRVGLGREDHDQDTSPQEAPSRQQASNFSGAGGRTENARSTADRDTGKGQTGAGNSGALDDGESGGVNYSNYSRHALMQRLAREEDALPVVSNTGNRNTTTIPSNAPTVPKSKPSRCVLVKNAYDESQETDPDWVTDLETDFKDECTDKYGQVVFCALYRDSPDGEIYLKFKDAKGGEQAVMALSGRLFGGRMLRAEPIVDAVFNTIFPAAANL